MKIKLATLYLNKNTIRRPKIRNGAKGISLFKPRTGTFLKINPKIETRIKNAVPIQNEYKKTEMFETSGENAGT